MHKYFPFLFVLALLPVCASAQIANNRILFVANLNSEQEAPQVFNDARGVATFLVSEDRTTLRIHGVFSGLSGPVTGCHVHQAPEAVSGPVFVGLTTAVSGNRLYAEIPLPPGFLAKGLRDSLYLNVHTAANPGGEIRGQLFIKTEIMYGTALDGLAETPPVTTNASGVIKFTYSPGQTKGRYFAVVDGLSGPITAAHIHDGPAGVAGPVYAPLTVASNNTLAGEFDFTGFPDFLGKLEAEGLYVNIHTAANPAGEVRGQLHSPGPFCFDAVLNGDQETPAVATAAGGISVASLTANLDTLVYKVSFHGLTPTAAHFHRGAQGTAGPVVVPLTLSSYPNFYAGRIAVPADFVSDLIAGDIYVNIHTAANPAGEIRGQMQPLLRTVYAFDLCGDQEAPPTGSPAEGAAVISMDRGNTHLDYLYIVDGLSGPATAAHIHEGAVGVSGPVYLGVFPPAPVGSGQFEATGDIFVKLESGDTYLNVHTAEFPAGEIRGQIGRELLCADDVPVREPLVSVGAVFPNPTGGKVEIQLNAVGVFDGQILLSDPAGQMLQAQAQAFGAGGQTVTLDLSSLPAGLYFVQIKTAQAGTVAAFKVVRE